MPFWNGSDNIQVDVIEILECIVINFNMIIIRGMYKAQKSSSSVGFHLLTNLSTYCL